MTVKGIFEPPKLVEYVYRKTGKHAVIVKQDPEKKEGEGEKKEDKGGEKAAAGGGKEEKGGGEEEAAKPEAGAAAEQVLDMKKNEFYYYHPQNYQVYHPTYTTESSYSSHSYPPAPQMFSDENPNACSVM